MILSVPQRLCPYIIGPTRLCPLTFMPTHVCAHTRLCPHMFVPTHVCPLTYLCPDTIVPRHDCAQTYLCPDTFVHRHISFVPRYDCAQTRLCQGILVPQHKLLRPDTIMSLVNNNIIIVSTRLIMCQLDWWKHVQACSTVVGEVFPTSSIPTEIFRYFMSGHQICVWAQSCLVTNVHVSAQTRLWPHDYNMSGHQCVWAQTCVGTIESGHKREWAQTCVGTNVCGHKRVWAHSCGLKCVWAQKCGLRFYHKILIINIEEAVSN